jgi:hypothetical protein
MPLPCVREHHGAWRTGGRPAPYRVVEVSNAMVHRIRRLGAIAIMAAVAVLAAACNNSGGSGY